MIIRLEELAANAWPAPRTALVDGWLARFASGYSRRANSVLPLYAGRGSDAERRKACEGLYRHQGLPAIFKLTEAAPPGLDADLKAAGYALEAPTSVMVLDPLPSRSGPAPAPAPEGLEASVADEAGDEWLTSWFGFSSVATKDRAVAAGIVGAIVPERRFILLKKGPSPVACALVVVDDGWAGVFDVVVRPEERGQGLGRAVMALALASAAEAGALRSYLQVMEDNKVAMALYASLGYRPAYRYWYRKQGTRA